MNYLLFAALFMFVVFVIGPVALQDLGAWTSSDDDGHDGTSPGDV